MRKNYPACIKLTQEENLLLEETLKKINNENLSPITKTALIRISIHQFCKNVKCGKIQIFQIRESSL